MKGYEKFFQLHLVKKGLAISKATPEVARGMHGGYEELLLPSINVT